MAYFAPYIDGAGLHMPSFDDRLEELWARYCEIFGVDPARVGAPDYQLLSAFARRLDDVSGLISRVYESRNYETATGNALDLLLPQYGLCRQKSTDTDERCRRLSRTVIASKGGCSYDSLEGAIRAVSGVSKYKVYANDTDAADDNGVPGHSVAVFSYGGLTKNLAQALYDHVPPGIGTYGTTAAAAYDSEGREHTVHFSRPDWKMTFVYPFITKLEGADETAINEAVVPAIMDYINALPIGGKLYVPQLYGVAYRSRPDIANTYIINDIQACFAGDPSITRDVLRTQWNEMFDAGNTESPNVMIQWRN